MDHPPPDFPNPYASPAIPTEVQKSSLSSSLNKPNEPLVEPIKILGLMYGGDAVLGSQITNRNSQLGCWNLIFYFYVLLLMCVFVFLGSFHPTSFTDLSEKLLAYSRSLSFPLKGFLWFVALTIILFFFFKWRYKNTQVALPQPKLEGLIEEDRFTIDWEDGTTTVKWSAFSKYQHSDSSIVLIYKNTGSPFLFTPYVFQTPEDWECFIGLLDRKLPRC